MSSFEGTTDIASDAMRAAAVKHLGRKAVHSASRPYTPPSLHRTWQPKHGIIFGSSLSLDHRRSSSVTRPNVEEEPQAHSNAEDNYVLAESLQPLGSSSKNTVAGNEMLDASSKPEDVAESNITVDEAVDEEVYSDVLPETNLDFKIVEDLFKAAQSAKPLTSDSYWSHNLYRGPAAGPGESPPKVKVHYCQSLHTTERVLSQYFVSQKVVGFDIEWSMQANRYSGPKQNVSLIQLATEERIALFHIALFAKDHVSALVAPSFKKLMEDPSITKVGVAIKGDCTRLRNNLNINSRGLFELSHLYKLIKYCESKEYKLINKKLISLAIQVKDHLHLPMFKGVDVRGSDWSKKINLQQISYAAADSYAGLQLYHVMDLKRQRLDPSPPLPYHAELNKPIRLPEGVTVPVDTTADDQEDLIEPVEIPATKRQTVAKRSKPSKQQIFDESDSDSSSSDFEPSQDLRATQTPSKTASTRSSSKLSTPASNSLLSAIEAPLITHKSRISNLPNPSTSTPKPRATTAQLRAYFLWSLNPSFSIAKIGGILRDPPLQISTVTSYILDAVRLDGEVLDEDARWDRKRVGVLLESFIKESGGKGWVVNRYARLRQECARGGGDAGDSDD